MKRTYAGVDLLKFIFSLCIVGIHTDVVKQWPQIEKYIFPFIFRLAVPFFFVCSGFFLARASSDEGFSIKHYIGRLATKMVVFEPISIFLFLLINTVYLGTSLLTFICEALQRIIFYPYGALWYIQALIVCGSIIYLFWRKHKYVLPVIIGLFLYLYALLCNNYYFITKMIGIDWFVDIYMKICITPRNGIFVAPAFISIGGLIYSLKFNSTSSCKIVNFTIKKNKNRLITMPVFLIIAFCMLAFELNMISGREKTDDGSLYMSYIILIPAVFITCIHPMWESFRIKQISKTLRHYSTSIYLLHSPVVTVLRYGSKYIGRPLIQITLYFATLIVVFTLINLINQFGSDRLKGIII